MSIGVEGNNGFGGWCYIAQVGTDTRKDLYNVPIGTSTSSSNRFSTSKTALGLTTIASESGIVVDISDVQFQSSKLGIFVVKY